MNTFQIGLRLAGILLVSFLPGFCLLNVLLPSRLRREELIAASFGISFLIFGTAAFTRFVLRIPHAESFNGLVLSALLALCLFYFIFYKPQRPGYRRLGNQPLERSFGQALAILCLYLLNIFALECILPVYAGGGYTLDWAAHYKTALVFSEQSRFHDLILSRMPLYKLIQGFFLPLFNQSFWQFQLVHVLLGSVFLISVYLLAEKLFDARAGLIAVCMMSLNPWCMHSSWYTTGRMLTVYFIILSIYFYICCWQQNAADQKDRRLYINLSALFAGLGYLTHALSLFYIIGISLDLLFLKGGLISFRDRLRAALSFFLIIIILVLPWYIYAVCASSLMKLMLASPAFSYQTLHSRTLINFAISRLHTGIFSVLPFDIIVTLCQIFVFRTIQLADILKALAKFYFNPLTGCLTLTGTLTSAAVFIRYLACKKMRDIRPSGHGIKLSYLFGFPALFLVLLLISMASILLRDKIDFEGLFFFYPERYLLLLFTITLVLAAICLTISYIASAKKHILRINDSRLTILAVILISYALAVIIFPGVSWHGILQNAMPPTAILIIICFCSIIYKLRLGLKICVLLGLIMETFTGIWLYMITLLENVLYKADYNWAIKSAHKIVFISDILSKEGSLFFICLAVSVELAAIVLFAIYLLRRPPYGYSKPCLHMQTSAET